MEELTARRVDVLVVTFENEELALNYQKETDLPWAMVIDKNRELYSYYGMEKAGFFDLWGLRTWKIYFLELLKGNLPKVSQADVSQRGGNVLIDPTGMVRQHYIGKGPADRPDIDDIFEIIDSTVQN